MRRLLLTALVLFLYKASFAQEIKYTDLNTSKRGEFTTYVSKDGSVYKIGDKIKIAMPSSNKTFAFISEGDGLLLPITQLKATSSGEETEIKRIWVVGSKRTGLYVTFKTKGFTGLSNYNVQIENAIESGEIKSFGMTSDEALVALRKAKDKLDLGLITQEDYDKEKSGLVKYIK